MHLQLTTNASNDGIDGYEQDHHSESGKHGGSHGVVQEEERQDDLQRSRPDHVEVGHEVHESLGIHGHEVDNLADRPGASGSTAQNQSLSEKCRGGQSVPTPAAYKCIQ